MAGFAREQLRLSEAANESPAKKERIEMREGVIPALDLFKL